MAGVFALGFKWYVGQAVLSERDMRRRRRRCLCIDLLLMLLLLARIGVRPQIRQEVYGRARRGADEATRRAEILFSEWLFKVVVWGERGWGGGRGRLAVVCGGRVNAVVVGVVLDELDDWGAVEGVVAESGGGRRRHHGVVEQLGGVRDGQRKGGERRGEMIFGIRGERGRVWG